jgi:hypothetical protein
MMSHNPSIPLTTLSRRLSEATGGKASYRMLYAAVLDGRLPAEQIRGRWHVPANASIEEIARKLGLPVV